MPRSRAGKRTRRSPAGVYASPPPRRTRLWRKRVGWSLCILGLALFLTGNVGARTGMVILPFDPHDVIGQLGGGVLIAVGFLLASPA